MVTLADALRARPAGFVEWHVAGKSLAVAIAFDVLEQILAGEGGWRKRSENGGLLLGRAEAGDPVRVIVESAVEVPCQHLFGPSYAASEDDKQAFRAAIAAAGENTRAVGFYRTHRRKGLALDADDLLLLSQLFPEPDNVALVIKPRRLREALGGFFFWEEGRIRQQSSYLEFAVHRKKRRVKFLGPRAEAAAPPAQPSAAEPTREPPPALRPRRRRKPLWCSWWIQGPLLACLLAADAYFGFLSARQFYRLAPPPAAPTDPYALALTVLEYGDNLQLTWDRRALPIASARGGQLVITDDDQSRTVELTGPQLRQGSIIYRKVGKQVRFRLEVFLDQHRSLSETWQSGSR